MSTKTLLDLIICTIGDSKTIASGVVDLGKSDHNLVYICRKVGIPKRKPKITETRQYYKLNAVKFQTDLIENFSILMNILTPMQLCPNGTKYSYK